MNLTKPPVRALLSLLVTATLGCIAVPAAAQWQWTDNNGKKVFSDSPPPQDVPDRNILKRPAGAAPAFTSKVMPAQATATAAASATPAANPAAVASTPKAGASAPKLSGKDLELEKKKTQAEADEAAKKKAEDQKHAAAKADNCERARRSLASLQSGARISQLNAQGEREFMSDEQRQAEMQRTQNIVSADCR